MSEQHIQHVWEFRAGCHNADDVHAQPCACASCTAKRRAAVAEQLELDDDAYVQFVGDKTRYSVRELRAAEAVSVDQQRNFERELRRRDSGFMRIVTADASGKGTYEAREDGATVTKKFTFDGAVILTPAFAKPTNAVTVTEAHEDVVPPPPDPWGPGLAAMRAASATPPPTFEDKWKAERLRALAIEHAAIDALVAAHPFPRMTAAEAAEIPAPPDPWKADLDKMRSERR